MEWLNTAATTYEGNVLINIGLINYKTSNWNQTFEL